MHESDKQADTRSSPRYNGFPTFARLPVSRRTDAQAMIIGVPSDVGSTDRPGGRFGPAAIRQASLILRQYNPALDVRPFEVLGCTDGGDVEAIPGFLHRTYEAVEQEVRPLVEKGVTPVFLGGDHACTLGHLRAVRDHAPVGLLLVDAHHDAWDDFYGEKYTHGTWLRRALEEGLVDPARSIVVGLRGSLYDERDWTMLHEELGIEYLTADEVHDQPLDAVLERIRLRLGGGSTFFSFDIDSVDPSFAPGTGALEVGGFFPRQVLLMVRGLAGVRFVGFDVVEVLPALDPSFVTANLAAHVAFEMLSVLALERLSRSDPA